MQINNYNNIQFKGFGNSALNITGNLMQGIENGGFLTSFLIQDGLGMTAPRTYAGFLRDKEITGEYNKQEGFEVLGREGLTGPCMMAVAPLGFYFSSKIGHSTTINSLLIKHYGENLEDFIKNNPDFKLTQNVKEFKKAFYTKNIKEMLDNSLGKNNYTKEQLDNIINKLLSNDSLNSKNKKNYRKVLNEISEIIDDIRYKTSDNLQNLQKINLGKDNNVKITEALDGLIKYTNDTIKYNNNLEKMNSEYAKRIKYSLLGKRSVTNISILLATLGILSILPKIYAKSDVAPSAKLKNKVNNKTIKNEQENTNVSFKGKENSIFEKIGKLVNKTKSKFIHKEFEYDGINFSNTLMTVLSLGGLLLPRGLRAFKRAPKDEETNKKDFSEIWEILIRDVTSSLTVVFGVPILTKLAVSSYEKCSGFVFMHKDRNASKFKQFIDTINPYGKTQVLNNSEVKSLYNNINSKEKMLNFCKYIDKNGGNLYKIFSKLDNNQELFEKFGLKNCTGMDKKSINKTILECIEKNIDKDILDKFIKNINSKKINGMTTFARGLTSTPKLLATVLIVPYLLGWTIPRLTYKNTQRLHAKQEQEKERLSSTNKN